MPSSKRPPVGWFETLPSGRLLSELSLWSANLSRLADDVRRVEPGTDLFHIDVSDGHFSAAMLFFPDLVARLREATAAPLHVHLMVSDAILISQIEQFADAGADLISLHAENANAAEGLDLIRARGLKSGLVLQLHTPVSSVRPLLAKLDMLTLLGTLMGIKGVGLSPDSEPRLREARVMVAAQANGHRVIVAADGGIRENTVPLLRRAGAETVVMGSLAFGAPDFASRINWLHGL